MTGVTQPKPSNSSNFWQDIPVKGSEVYTATMYLKCPVNKGDALASNITQYSGSIASGWTSGTITDMGVNAGVFGWTKYTAKIVTASNTTKIRWSTYSNLFPGDVVYADDFSLVDNGAEPTITSSSNPNGLGAVRTAGNAKLSGVQAIVTKVVDSPASGQVEFFAEDSSRDAGYLIECPNADKSWTGTMVPGWTVSITGATGTSADTANFPGESCITCNAALTRVGTTVTPLVPLGTTLAPIANKTGLTLDGMYVRVGGDVDTEPGVDFTINDGSSADVLVGPAFYGNTAGYYNPNTKKYVALNFPDLGATVVMNGCAVISGSNPLIYITSADPSLVEVYY